MKNHNTRLRQAGRRSSIIAMLLLAFTFAEAQFVVTPVITPACHGTDGAVTFNLSGAQSGTHYFYVYATNGSSNYPNQTSPTFTGLAPGNYNVYVTGVDSTSLNIDISNLISLSGTVTNTTCPTNTGQIAVTATGGAGSYSYLWSNGAITPSISSLAGGVYTVTVTDGNGCVATQQDTVQALSSLVVSISSNNISCNPTLTASATNGTGAVTYHWNTNQNTASISGLTYSTTYRVTATDANGCTATASTYVNLTSLTVDSGLSTVVNPGCNNNNGSIAVNMQNGVAPYTYLWSNGAQTGTITNLGYGSYTVTVTDVNGCSAVGYYTLNLSSQIAAYICAYTNPGCGASDGSITACGYGGNGTLTYAWSNSATGAVISGLPAATYTVTVSDGTGCSATTSETLHGQISDFTATISSTPTACDSSLHTGTATATVTTGSATPPFSFAWFGGSYLYGQVAPIGSTQTISGIAYGTVLYVTVTDANGCITGSTTNDSTVIHYDPACFDHITGYAFQDVNSNCIKDAGERGLGGINISATGPGGQTYYANTDTTGYYDIEVLPGTYTVTEYFNYFESCVTNICGIVYRDSFSTTGVVSTGNNFGQSASLSADLGVHTGYQGSAPGSQKEYWVYYYNRGSVTSPSSTTLTFVHDANINLVSTNPAYTTYNSTTHTITWAIGSVPVSYWNSAQQVTMIYDIPATLPLGTQLSAYAEIDPLAGDCNPADNTQSLSDIVSASHDPNEKEVSPSGNLTAADSVLTYTIRFQNNGNAPASRVVVTDTLSSNVNPGSVEKGASSAPYTFAVTGSGILTFTFDGINLPDSAHGDSSKGFVNYTVHTKPNLPIGSIINNTAFIYFDRNPAVVTNTTVSERSDFQTGIRSINTGDMAVTVSPNPVLDRSIVHITGATGAVQFCLTDVTGQKVMETTTTDREVALQAEMFASGMYLYTVKDASGATRSGKVSIAH